MKIESEFYSHPVHHEIRVKKTKWVVLRYPNQGMAEQAGMSTDAFEDFYFNVLCNEDLKINYYINQDHFIRGSATEAKIVFDADHAWNNTEIKDVKEHLNECKGYFEEIAEEVNKKLKP